MLGRFVFLWVAFLASSAFAETILVTGAAGYVGGKVAERLNEMGNVVRVVVRTQEQAEKLSGKGYEVHVGDLSDFRVAQSVVWGVDRVVHAAARVTDYGRKGLFKRDNVKVVHNLAEAASMRHVRRFVHISTVDVLGFPKNGVLTDESPMQRTRYPYAQSKYDGEKVIWDAIENRDLKAVILRPTGIYGPEDRSYVPGVVKALTKGQAVYLGSRDNRINLNYITNLVDLIEHVLFYEDEAGVVGRAFISNDFSEPTLEDFFEGIRKATVKNLRAVPPFADFARALKNAQKPIRTMPLFAASALGHVANCAYLMMGKEERPTLTPEVVAWLGGNVEVNATALATIGFMPKVNFQEGMRLTSEWLQGQNLLKLVSK